MNPLNSRELEGTHLNSFKPLELKETYLNQKNSRELKTTQGNSRELKATWDSSREALVEVRKEKIHKGKKTQEN